MKLYMIHHGQSEANIEKMQAGQADFKLTEQGKKDALGAKEVLKDIEFDKKIIDKQSNFLTFIQRNDIMIKNNYWEAT